MRRSFWGGRGGRQELRERNGSQHSEGGAGLLPAAAFCLGFRVGGVVTCQAGGAISLRFAGRPTMSAKQVWSVEAASIHGS